MYEDVKKAIKKKGCGQYPLSHNLRKFTTDPTDGVRAQIAYEKEVVEKRRQQLDTPKYNIKWRAEPSNSKIGALVIKFLQDKMTHNISIWLDSRLKTVKSAGFKAHRDINRLIATGLPRDEIIYKLYLITHSSVFNTLIKPDSTHRMTVSTLAYEIGKNIFLELNMEEYISAKRYFNMGEYNKVKSKKYKLSFLSRFLSSRKDNVSLRWTEQDIAGLGVNMLNILLSSTDLYDMKVVVIKNKKGIQKKYNCIIPTPAFERMLSASTDFVKDISTHYPVCLIPPLPWKGMHEGGYYGVLKGKVPFIKQRARIPRRKQQQLYNFMNEQIRPEVFEGVNVLQKTGFSINKYILDILNDIKEMGAGVFGLPILTPLEHLPRLTGDFTEDELKAHKRKQYERYIEIYDTAIQKIRFLHLLSLANQYSKFPEFYYVHNLDFRGRVYPLHQFLTYQGDDLQKALLQFSKKEPIKDSDVMYLKIYLANLAGVDKVTIDERIKWVDDNTNNIIESAKDPLNNTWWYNQAKDERPFLFLSFCKEYADLCNFMQQNKGSAEGFLSSAIIAFDGTCSGLQHYSALLRDEEGARFVNLLPEDNVNDFYTEIAKKVSKYLKEDQKSGTADMLNDKNKMVYGTKTLSNEWIRYNLIHNKNESVSRKICKRNAMTFTYGATVYTFAFNILTEFIRKDSEQLFQNPNQASFYLARLTNNAIKETTTKAYEGMKWLQQCLDSDHVQWKTLDGLPVHNLYMKNSPKSFKYFLQNKNLTVYFNDFEDETKDLKSNSEVAPNFIHSLDATHLRLVLRAEYNKGNNFLTAVHDSFCTNLAHSESLFKTIREEFYKMYTDNDLLSDLKKYNNEEPPMLGTLDLKLVLDSKYSFI